MTRFGAPVRPVGRSAPAVKGPRPAGSWAAAIVRARESWDGLTGGPRPGACDCGGPDPRSTAAMGHRPGCASFGVAYTDTAAAAILSTALGLWSDVAAAMGEDTGD